MLGKSQTYSCTIDCMHSILFGFTVEVNDHKGQMPGKVNLNYLVDKIIIILYLLVLVEILFKLGYAQLQESVSHHYLLELRESCVHRYERNYSSFLKSLFIHHLF